MPLPKKTEEVDELEEGFFEDLTTTLTTVLTTLFVAPLILRQFIDVLGGYQFFLPKPGKKVEVGTESTLVLKANERRKYASFVNDSLQIIYLSLGWPAAVGEGIRLNPEGGWYEIRWGNLFRGDVFAIVPTGVGSLTVVEGE